jgi:hypothetical protein
MPKNRGNLIFSILFFYLAFMAVPIVCFGQGTVKYDEEIKQDAPVRYGPEIQQRESVRYGVDIRAEDIRQVEPGVIVPEEVPSDFEFDMRNYFKVSGYYDSLKKWPDINADNLLQLEETAFFLEPNTQFSLSYLEDYVFTADISYQWSPGSSEQSDRDTHFITNEFYFDLYLADLAYVKAGKKRELWGVGWTFSPIDFIMGWPKNLVDPTESREGKYLALLEAPVGDASFSFVYFPDVTFDMQSEWGQSGIPDTIGEEQGSLGAKARFLLWDTDLSLVYYRTDKIPDLMKNYYGLSLSRYWLDLGAYVDIEGHQGNDLERVQKTEIGQYAFLSGEDLVEYMEADDDIYVNFAVGANYTFPEDSKITLEYYRNSEGYNDEEFDEFVKFVGHEANIYRLLNDSTSEKKLLKANQLLANRIRQNYLSISYDRPNTFDDFFPHLGVLMCLDDGSSLVNGAVTYNVRDDTSLSLDARAYLGDSDTEWGMKPDNYRIYLKATYFF